MAKRQTCKWTDFGFAYITGALKNGCAVTMKSKTLWQLTCRKGDVIFKEKSKKKAFLKDRGCDFLKKD